MKNRMPLFAVIISLLILISGFLTMLSQASFSRRTASIIRDNYRSNGLNIAETIKASFDKGIEVSRKMTDYIYEEMLNDLRRDRKRYLAAETSPAALYDTVTEGFYFSNKQNADSFSVHVYDGRVLYSISRSKAFFNSLEKSVGPGKYVQDLGNLSSVEYIAIQDEQGIVTATPNVKSLSNIFSDSLLSSAYVDGERIFRKTRFGSMDVYEYIYPVEDGKYIIRVGFEAAMIDNALAYSSRMMLALLLIIISTGLLMLLMLFFYTRSVLYAQRAIIQEKEMERLREENEMKERAAMLGELSFKVAHELKNPLNGISIILQRVLRKASMDKDERGMLEDALGEVGRMNAKITDFTKFAKPPEYSPENFKIMDLVKEVVESIKPSAGEKNVEIATTGKDAECFCDREQIREAVKNILINAVEAVGREGRIRIHSDSRADGAVIDIEDDGPGIPEEERERVLELYYTTKKEGSGIGLTSSYRAVRESGGRMEITGSSLGGALVRIVLPANKE